MAGDDASTTDQLRQVAIEAARTQLVAVTAATKFWAGWIQAADKFAQGISSELGRIEEQKESADLVGRLSDLTREYLRDLIELPNITVKHFNAELEKIGQPRKRRARAARVKD